MIVAVDGPAGAGKSTVARLVALRLGLAALDSGATYRLVGTHALRRSIDLEDGPTLAELARELSAAVSLGPDAMLHLYGAPIEGDIRTHEAGDAASRVARHAEVREVLVALQRRIVPPAGAVVEGRDIGTVVFPDAAVKVWLEADQTVRTQRRQDEGHVAQRDERDAGRTVSPMRPAAGALIIDTTSMPAEQVAERILDAVGNARQWPIAARMDWLTRAARFSANVILHGPLRLKIEGADHIPARGPAILAPNHRSLIDIPAVTACTTRKVYFMAKEELTSAKVIGPLLLKMGAFPVRRGAADRQALKTAIDVLQRGDLLGLYAEGTRAPDSRFLALHDGLAYIALKTGAPIVPVALSGTERVMPKGRKLPRFVQVRIRFGPAFSLGGPSNLVRRAMIEEATEVARKHLQANLAELEPLP